MKVVLHAVGRSQDVLPYLAIGALVREVQNSQEAVEAVKAAARQEGALILLSEEFAAAGEYAAGALVFVSPGVRGAESVALEKTRELVTRSLGVDLIAKAGGGGRKRE